MYFGWEDKNVFYSQCSPDTALNIRMWLTNRWICISNCTFISSTFTTIVSIVLLQYYFPPLKLVLRHDRFSLEPLCFLFPLYLIASKAGSFLLSRSQLKSHFFREVFSDHPFLSHSPCPRYTIISPSLIVVITIIAIWKYLNLFNYLFTFLIEYEFPRAETWYALH